ncbi:MAG: Fur family transcriptional regulator [Anaerovoracaceae bacterium]
MKYSKQREIIKNAVMANPIHPTADEVYALLKPKNPALSLGTVYRNLNLLSEIGEIKKINIPNASDRFDGKISEHYHAICSKCSEVYDLDFDLKDKLSKEMAKSAKIKITNYKFIAEGICENCLANEK